MRTVPRKAKSTTAGMKRKRAAAPVAKDTLAAAIAVSAGAVSSAGGALSGKAAASGKDAPATESTPSASDVLGSDGTPSAGNVTDATTPTPKSNRPTRGATKRRYTIADYPGFDDEDFEPDLADSSDEVGDEEGAVRTSKVWRPLCSFIKSNGRFLVEAQSLHPKETERAETVSVPLASG